MLIIIFYLLVLLILLLLIVFSICKLINKYKTKKRWKLYNTTRLKNWNKQIERLNKEDK